MVNFELLVFMDVDILGSSGLFYCIHVNLQIILKMTEILFQNFIALEYGLRT